MSRTNHPSREVILVAVYADEAQAQRAIESLSAAGAALDMLSVLGRVHASGDDVLGIAYGGTAGRVRAWAKQGAFWGAVWGLLTGGAAMFILPGVGALFAAGPVVDAVAAALAGGTMGAAAMAGAAALTQVATSLHRLGIPPERVEQLHQAVVKGHFVLMLREASDKTGPWREILQRNATEVLELPYSRVVEMPVNPPPQ